jgi:hypothetical protein
MKRIRATARKWAAVHTALTERPDSTRGDLEARFPWLATELPSRPKALPMPKTPTPAAAAAAKTPAATATPATDGELTSSRVEDVEGLALAGPASTMYHGDQATGTPPAGAPASAQSMRTANRRRFSYADAKKMLARSVRDAWPTLKETFALEDVQESRFVALMLGQATRESTLAVDIETGTAKGYGKDPAHAYGLLQTAVTAFRGAAEQYGYEAEADVPGLHWYAWTPENFYDPMISNFMGLRKMCHFATQARAKYGVTDPREVLRLSLQAHNTGHANPGNDANYMAGYPDMCARMGEYYLAKGHMDDDTFTWTANHSGFPTSYPEPARGAAWKDNWAWFWK